MQYLVHAPLSLASIQLLHGEYRSLTNAIFKMLEDMILTVFNLSVRLSAGQGYAGMVLIGPKAEGGG